MFSINKSSHHAKIAGNYGEHSVLYWLSLSGFECVHADHTGIDIIAAHKSSGRRWGISVKTRSWLTSSSLQVGDLFRLDEACKDFGLEPYIALVNDNRNAKHIFIMAKDVFLRHVNNKDHDFSMSEKHLSACINDKEIMTIRLDYKVYNWLDETPTENDIVKQNHRQSNKKTENKKQQLTDELDFEFDEILGKIYKPKRA